MTSSLIMLPETDAVSTTRTPAIGLTWWFSDLPGAGKTTLAQACCVLDGDELRRGLSSDLNFSARDRFEQCRRTAEIARVLNSTQINAIVALVSPTRESGQGARALGNAAPWPAFERRVQAYFPVVTQARSARVQFQDAVTAVTARPP